MDGRQWRMILYCRLLLFLRINSPQFPLRHLFNGVVDRDDYGGGGGHAAHRLWGVPAAQPDHSSEQAVPAVQNKKDSRADGRQQR